MKKSNFILALMLSVTPAAALSASAPVAVMAASTIQAYDANMGQGSVSVHNGDIGHATAFEKGTVLKFYRIYDEKEGSLEIAPAYADILNAHEKRVQDAFKHDGVMYWDSYWGSTSLYRELDAVAPDFEVTIESESIEELVVTGLAKGGWIVMPADPSGTLGGAMTPFDRIVPQARFILQGDVLGADVNVNARRSHMMKHVQEDDLKHYVPDIAGQDQGAGFTWGQDSDDVPADKAQRKGNDGFALVTDRQIGDAIPFVISANGVSTDRLSAQGATSISLKLEDTMSDALELDKDSITVNFYSASDMAGYRDRDQAPLVQLTADQLDITRTDTGFKLQTPDLIPLLQGKGPIGVYTGFNIEIRYEARLMDKDLDHGTDAMINTSVLTLEAPELSVVSDTNSAAVYTFSIDGKAKADDGSGLAGATFALYRDEVCTEAVKVRSENGAYVADGAGDAVITSGADGAFQIIGLDQGTHYLKALSVPEGYVLDQTPAKAVIAPEFGGQAAGNRKTVTAMGFQWGTQNPGSSETCFFDEDPFLTKNGDTTVDIDFSTEEKPPVIEIPDLPSTGGEMALLAVTGTGLMTMSFKRSKKEDK